METEKKHRDWLPTSRSAIINMATTWSDYITSAKAIAWHIPTSTLEELAAKCMQAQTCLTAVSEPSASRNDRTACNTAFAELKSLMRNIKNHYFHRPELTDLDFTGLGLEIPDDTKSPIPVPEEDAPFSMQREGFMHVRIHHGKRPYGCTGASLSYEVLPADAPAPTFEQLSESMLLTRINEYLDFPDTLEGHVLYAALRWQNAKGDEGRPTPVQHLVLG